MNTINIALPPMGEGITDATITRWLVSIGDPVEEDQSLVEVATDKVDSEIPSPAKGKIIEILFKEGETPRIGQVLARIETEGVKNKNSTQEGTIVPADKLTPETKSNIGKEENLSDDNYTPFISPLVRSIARQEGIERDELKKIIGSGLNNRITRSDIMDYLEQREKKTLETTRSHFHNMNFESGGIQPTDGVMFEVIKMDRMRKLIAEHMVRSKQTSPHVTSYIEVDVSNLVQYRENIKDSFQKNQGEKLTFTPLFIEAVVKALKQHPFVNSSVDGDNLIVKKTINIGIATNLPSGNLIVPVIKNAGDLNLSGIAKSLNDLARRARENQLKPDEIQGGTFTITNLGMFGTLTGSPIINQPQVAILSIGSITKRPVVIESPDGDSIGIRKISILSLSYDHRIVDGALAGAFLQTIKQNIQSINPNAL